VTFAVCLLKPMTKGLSSYPSLIMYRYEYVGLSLRLGKRNFYKVGRESRRNDTACGKFMYAWQVTPDSLLRITLVQSWMGQWININQWITLSLASKLASPLSLIIKRCLQSNFMYSLLRHWLATSWNDCAWPASLCSRSLNSAEPPNESHVFHPQDIIQVL